MKRASRFVAAAVWGLMAGPTATPSSASEAVTTQAIRHAVLFAHDAGRGTYQPAGPRGEFRLVLDGVAPSVLFFEDRPGRAAGHFGMRRMLDGFYAQPGGDPPNAAIEVTSRTGRQYLVALELLDGRYDASRRRVVYRVRRLAGDRPTTVAHRRVRTHDTLPHRFRSASVFIDSFYDTCQGSLANPSTSPWSPQSATAGETDTWEFDDGTLGTPPTQIQAGDLTGGYWQTTAALGRECSNTVTFTSEDGAVLVVTLGSGDLDGDTVDVWSIGPNPDNRYTPYADATGTTITATDPNPDDLYQCFVVESFDGTPVGPAPAPTPPAFWSGGSTRDTSQAPCAAGRVGSRP